jgi:hypothetical protein
MKMRIAARGRRLGARAGSSIEPLEHRVLLAQIFWENRFSDNFGIYGADADIAREIVDRAIVEWSRVIVNFNYAGGAPNRFNLDIRAAPIGGRGVTNDITFDSQRKPTSANIVMDDNGAGSGWYFDPLVGTGFFPDDSEYTDVSGPFSARIPDGNIIRSDFYRTILHEIGHAVGITVGDGLKINDFLADSGVDDPNDPGTATIRWIDFGYGEVGTMTEAGGGHLYEGPALPGQAVNVVHPDDLLNDGRTVASDNNRRQLINDLHARILHEAYGYTVAMPSKMNTFYVNFNIVTGVTTIGGMPAGSNDIVTAVFTSPNMVYEVYQDVNHHYTELVQASNVAHTLIINTGDGADQVSFGSLAFGLTAGVNTGPGNDRASMSSGDIDTNMGGNVTFTGGSGIDRVSFYDYVENNPSSDHYHFFPRPGDPDGGIFAKDSWSFNGNYTGFEQLELFASDDGGNINVNYVPVIMTAELRAGDKDNKFRIAPNSRDYAASIRGNLILHGEPGNDNIEIHDQNGGAGNYAITSTYFRKDGGGTTSWQTCESLVVNQASGNMVVNILGVANSMAYYLYGGTGDDTFNLGDGTMTALNGSAHLNGGAGADAVRFLDDANTSSGLYQITPTALLRSVGDGGGGLNYTAIEGINLRTGPGANDIQVLGTAANTPVSIFANDGTDTIRVYETSPSGPVTIEPSTGNDSVNINGSSTLVRFAATQRIGALTVFGGVARVAAPSGKMVLTTTSLNVDDGGRLDLTDEAMIIDYAVAYNLATLQARLASGYAGGAWNGQGINSSTAAAAGGATGVGYAESGQIFSAFPATFEGQPVDATAIVLKYTYYGDANLDGRVNLQDFNRLAANFGATGRHWSQGNFDFNNVVNLLDFNKLAANFGRTGLAPDARDGLDRQLDDVQDRLTDSEVN